MRRLINRYILKEIAVPFCMILFVLTFVLLMGKILQLMDLMINKGIRFRDIAQLIFFLMPSFLMFTIPISLLIAILIGIGRLSGDNEITVLKMSGVSLYQLAIPVAVTAVAAFAMTAATTLFLVPAGNWAAKNLLYDMAKQKASIAIREKIFIDDFRGILLYAEKIRVQGDFLEGVLISDNRIIREPSTIIARKAYLVSDPETLAITLRLEDGSIHTADAGLKHYRKIDFHFYDVRLDLPASLSDEQKNGKKASTDMTIAELSAMLSSRGLAQETLREMAIELNKKLTIPLSCLVFALVALPLGIRVQRSIRARGFTIGLVIVLLFYLMRLGGEALVETGRLSAVVGTWTPNAVFAVAGILLFIFSAREQHPWAFFRSGAFEVCDRAPVCTTPPSTESPAFPLPGSDHPNTEALPADGANSGSTQDAAKEQGGQSAKTV